jgi:His/Glu/Gln/Arg/opine family amino acid ABC transporter permease subunit
MMPSVLIDNFWYLLKGAVVTVKMSAASIVLSSLVGIIVALIQIYGNAFIRAFMLGYLYINRGVPLLVLLFAMYFVLPYAGINLQPFLGAILVISLYFGAFMSEVFRGAIISLPKGQWEAAKSLGMRRLLMLWIIIFPQAIRLAIPPFLNTCMVLVKSTSQASIIGVWELTLAGREVAERTTAAFQIFAGVGIIYFCICYALSRFGRHLEERIHHGH